MTATRPRLLVVALLLTGACTSAGGQVQDPSAGQGRAPVRAEVDLPASPPPGDRYAATVDASVGAGLQTWLEVDLLRSWQAGDTSFRTAVARVGALARRRGVRGVKIADELGHRDGTTGPVQVNAFLSDAAEALHRVAPGRLLLVDVVVPELGCLPWRRTVASSWCAARERARDPGATLLAIDSYLASGTIDVVDVSAGLRPDEQYAAWHITRDEAMRQAWHEVGRRGWGERVRLQARKALAHPGAWSGGAVAARRQVTTFVDVPLREGALAVDVWTWRQSYRGQVVRLLDPGAQDNALWHELAVRRAAGAVLWTHLSPSSLEHGLAEDVARLATVFSGVFVAAGAG